MSDSEALAVLDLNLFFRTVSALPGFAAFFATMPEETKASWEFVASDETAKLFSIKRVIERQTSKSQKAKDYIPGPHVDASLQRVAEVLVSLKDLSCGICGLNGHENSYCWLNGQVYGVCRSRGWAYQEANILWREGLRARQTIKMDLHRDACRDATRDAQFKQRQTLRLFRVTKNAVKASQRVEGIERVMGAARKKARL